MDFYNKAFYEAQSSGSKSSAEQILPELFSIFSPRSAIDVGCGVGTWLGVASGLGVSNFIGIDGAYVDRKQLQIPERNFVPLDLENRRLSEAWSTGAAPKFDIAMTLEVAEHLSLARAETFVHDLVALSDVILFAAAVPFQGGENHVNEQWPEFWEILFRKHGYRCYDFLRAKFWGNQKVEWWYAQNCFLYIKSGSPAEALVPADAQVGSRALVHPKNYLSQILVWYRTHRHKAEQEEVADYATLVQVAGSGSSELPALMAVQRAVQNPGARDVFPYTRMTVSWPEETINALQEQDQKLRADLLRMATTFGRDATDQTMQVSDGLMQSDSWEKSSPSSEQSIMVQQSEQLLQQIETLTTIVAGSRGGTHDSAESRRPSRGLSMMKRLKSWTAKKAPMDLPQSAEAMADLLGFMSFCRGVIDSKGRKSAQRTWRSFVDDEDQPYLRALTLRGQEERPLRFFVLVGGGGLGDILMATPLLDAIKKRFHPCEIIVGYEPRVGKEALARNADVSCVLNSGWGGMRKAAAALQHLDVVDAVIYVRCFIPHFSFTASSRMRKHPQAYIFDLNAQATKALLGYSSNLGISILDRKVRRHYLDIVGAVSNLAISRDSELKFVPDPEEANISNLVPTGFAYVTVRDGANPGDYALALANGVSRTTKQLSKGRWAPIIKEIQKEGIKIVQVGSDSEELLDGVDIDLRSKTTLSQLYFVMQGAKAHLDTEGGLVHFSRAAKTPAAVLFGPTSKSFFAYPGNLNIASSECHGCWYAHDEWVFRCMKGDADPRCFSAATPARILEFIRNPSAELARVQHGKDRES